MRITGIKFINLVGISKEIKMCLCDNLFPAIWLSARADNLVMYFERREVIMPASVVHR